MHIQYLQIDFKVSFNFGKFIDKGLKPFSRCSAYLKVFKTFEFLRHVAKSIFAFSKVCQFKSVSDLRHATPVEKRFHLKDFVQLLFSMSTMISFTFGRSMCCSCSELRNLSSSNHQLKVKLGIPTLLQLCRLEMAPLLNKYY